jgi:putative restriction endonuclease
VDQTTELQLRSEAIAFVRALSERYAAVPHSELEKFTFRGEPVFLKAQQGIFKPKELSLPLSIRTSFGSPYADETIDGERVRYDFAPRSREYDNDGLKRCQDLGVPLIYFYQVKAKPNPEYYVFAPVFISAWDDASRTFIIDLSERTIAPIESMVAERPQVAYLASLQKNYVETRVERRLHQARFRNNILAAYRDRCAVCVLRLAPVARRRARGTRQRTDFNLDD